MRLGKDEIQKIVLGALLAILIIFVYLIALLGPLEANQAESRNQLNLLGPKMSEAKKQLKKTADLEALAPKAALVIKQLTSLNPDGSPVAWFPPQVEELFKRKGIDKATTRMNGELQEKELPGFRHISWAVEIPTAEFLSLGQALADFENEQLLAEIEGIQIEPGHADPELQHVSLVVNNIVKQ
jgi:hypothetical protein